MIPPQQLPKQQRSPWQTWGRPFSPLPAAVATSRPLQLLHSKVMLSKQAQVETGVDQPLMEAMQKCASDRRFLSATAIATAVSVSACIDVSEREDES